jgi:hypothetical protein
MPISSFRARSLGGLWSRSWSWNCCAVTDGTAPITAILATNEVIAAAALVRATSLFFLLLLSFLDIIGRADDVHERL